ncbi:MAG: associated Golgi protein [Verrucomicrobia bacterium]|nr:associated Golgi protein [Verrucomicrobiota bacterium]
MKRPSTPALLKLAGGLGLIAVAGWFATRGFDFKGAVDRLIAFFREAGPLEFFIAMALLPAAGVPLSPFTVAAGPVFGPVMGVGNVILCCLAAVAVNVALSYWIASRALRPLATRLVRWLGYELPEIRGNSTWTVSLLVRIVPGPPFFLQSYLLGLARVPFGVYMTVSTIVPAAYISAMVLLGDGLMRGDRVAMIEAAAIFFVAGGVLHQLRMRFKAKASRREATANGRE